MSDRDEDIAAFLLRSGCDNAALEPLKGDLSSRRYFRVIAGGPSMVLMDLPSDLRTAIPTIADRTARLDAKGLSVPRILARDDQAGLLLLEDFGDLHLADMIRRGDEPEELLTGAIDVLQRVREASPEGLSDPQLRDLAEWTALIDDWYPGTDAAAGAKLRGRLAQHLAMLESGPKVMSLRDHHVENILWLGERVGLSRFGLLDFQDAFLCHPIYDVASLLRDARIDIDADVVERLLARAAAQIGMPFPDARYAFDVLSLQRNLRILAIFHRAARRDGKTQHDKHLHRVRGHVLAAARNPSLDDIASLLDRVIPSPNKTAAA